MKHDQFIKLPFREQCMLIKDLAVKVATRHDQGHKYFLYQLDSFYIELKVQLYEDIVEELISFSANNSLNKYLESIDISNIIR